MDGYKWQPSTPRHTLVSWVLIHTDLNIKYVFVSCIAPVSGAPPRVQRFLGTPGTQEEPHWPASVVVRQGEDTQRAARGQTAQALQLGAAPLQLWEGTGSLSSLRVPGFCWGTTAWHHPLIL